MIFGQGHGLVVSAVYFHKAPSEQENSHSLNPKDPVDLTHPKLTPTNHKKKAERIANSRTNIYCVP